MPLKTVIRSCAIAVLLSSVTLAQKAPAKRPVNKPVEKAAVSKECPIPRTDNQQVYRVILKDGTYQPVTKCELQDGGNRVHFWSAERADWEDIPNSLVDWEATVKYAKEAPAPPPAANSDAASVDAEEASERKEEEARSPEVKPGLRLPEQGGVFVLDYWHDVPELDELVQNGGDISKNTGRNILRAAINPLAKAKQTIELKGAHARVQAHVSQPAIYINVDSDQDTKTGPDAEDMSQHFRIVRADVKKNSRVVGAIEVAVYGKVSQKASFIETHAEPVSSEWVKITPAQPLEPGEYAVVEMLGKDINLYVWDFGVHPTAPQNDKPWKAAPASDTSTGTNTSPVLKPPPENQ